MKTLKQLKKEGKPPEMRPNGTNTHDSFMYVPRNRKYFDWYYSAQNKKLNEEGK